MTTVKAFGTTRECQITILRDGIGYTSGCQFLARTRTGSKLYPVDGQIKQQPDGTWKLNGNYVTILRRPATIVCWSDDTRVRETSITTRNGWQS